VVGRLQRKEIGGWDGGNEGSKKDKRQKAGAQCVLPSIFHLME
jgi:hypothetical protein